MTIKSVFSKIKTKINCKWKIVLGCVVLLLLVIIFFKKATIQSKSLLDLISGKIGKEACLETNLNTDFSAEKTTADSSAESTTTDSATEKIVADSATNSATNSATENSEQTDSDVDFSSLEQAFVIRVIDGDTIKLSDGRKVRYIGIDTPEISNFASGVECYGKEASAKNSDLVKGKIVYLEKDTSETDRYNRILRYVYVDGLMVNEWLVKEGYAHASSYPPDVKYQKLFSEAEKNARENKKGLWGTSCQKEDLKNKNGGDEISNPVGNNDGVASKNNAIIPNNLDTENHGKESDLNVSKDANTNENSYICNCQKTCANLSCEEAQYQLNKCGCSQRDGDNDGIACDGRCQ